MPNGQLQTMVYVFAYGGLRRGEAASLRRSNVDVLRRQLQIAEVVAEISGHLVFGTNRAHLTRTAHLPPLVADMLGIHLAHVEDDPEALVFTTPESGPLRYTNTRQTVGPRARPGR